MFNKRIVLFLYCWVLQLSLTSASWGANELFQAPQSYPSDGMYAVSIAVADVNGDGKLDVLVPDGCTSRSGNCYGGVGVLLGKGDGTFKAVQTYDSGAWFANAVAVGDVNGDGKPDLLMTNRCSDPYCYYGSGSVGVLMGNGDGTFQPAQIYYSGGSNAVAIAIGDVNGDGNLDLLVANNYYPGGVGVLLGNGNGTFQPAQTYGQRGAAGPGSLVVADVNGDGKPDLLSTIQYMTTKHDGGVEIMSGNGDGTFQPPQIYLSGGKIADAMAVSDVNGDGKLDLLVANECMAEGCGHGGSVTVLLGNCDGTFQSPQVYKPGGFKTSSVAVGDVNGDGKPDLLVVNTDVDHSSKKGVGVLLGNGDGTFLAAETYDSGGDSANSIALGDVNGDRKGDLLVAIQCYDLRCAYGGFVSVMLGRFSTTTNLYSSLNPSVYGQAVTFSAKIGSGGPDAPTGTVTFKNGDRWLGKATVNGGVATLMTKALPSGTLPITVTYNGDPESIKSTSAPLSQAVGKATSTITIRSSVNPSVQGQPVTFTAKVTSPTALVTGVVTFTTGSTTLGTVNIRGGWAVMTGTLPFGSNTVTATYDGTANIIGSAASLTQIVK